MEKHNKPKKPFFFPKKKEFYEHPENTVLTAVIMILGFWIVTLLINLFVFPKYRWGFYLAPLVSAAYILFPRIKKASIGTRLFVGEAFCLLLLFLTEITFSVEGLCVRWGVPVVLFSGTVAANLYCIRYGRALRTFFISILFCDLVGFVPALVSLFTPDPLFVLSIVSLAFSAVSITAVLIASRRFLASEFKRKFHI